MNFNCIIAEALKNIVWSFISPIIIHNSYMACKISFHNANMVGVIQFHNANMAGIFLFHNASINSDNINYFYKRIKKQ